MVLLQLGNSLFGTIEHAVIPVIDLFTLFALIIQCSFLLLIFRITWLRDNLLHTALQNQNLIAYTSNLEKNLDDIKDMKHDIKNIFLTMGHFVSESGNPAMQAFYSEKISPYVADEIARSDIYTKLMAIDDEPLKAFLYYKISQAITWGIRLELDIAPYPHNKGAPDTEACTDKAHNFIAPPKMEFADLIRILGILLDNAIEECMETDAGAIVIRMARNDELVSYTVKNTVRDIVREQGIKAGVSSKGRNRGKGLIICRGIIEKYDCIALNSYFQEDNFIQNLVCYDQKI